MGHRLNRSLYRSPGGERLTRPADGFTEDTSASPIVELDMMELLAHLPADRKFVDYKGRT